jgi:DNA repair protein RadD
MMTHVKELIDQNAEKMRQHWPGAPMGIYSASIGRRDLGEPITFAGIQSVRSKARELGYIDLVIIDECHLVNHKDEGGYRRLLDDLMAINPAIRVVGLTATPYRLGHGLITDKPALFDALIEPISIEELIFKGYLSTLRSKVTKAKLDVTGVHKRGGEFIESELQAAVDTDDKNQAVVQEVMALAGDRKAWLFFCAGVKHAEHIAEALRQQGVTAACVTGDTPKKQRDEMIADFKVGKLQALTNANVLTTGFDYPDIDLVVMLRPTMSASLYVQMAGRGMRVKSHTDHCLVLDFAGVVETHGPITNVQPPKKGGDGNGEAPVKVCENCDELVHISVMVCPACQHPFPVKEAKKLQLHNDDIMGLEGQELEVTSWTWRWHTSKASGKQMLAVTYYGSLSDGPITEYLPILHDGYAGQMALQKLLGIARSANCVNAVLYSKGHDIAIEINKQSTPPRMIEYRKDGKFFKVTRRKWE